MKTASWFSFFGPGRVSISRGAPRSMGAGYKVFRPLMPGPWFRTVPPEEYIQRYRDEILAPLDPQKTWDALHALAGEGNEPVLLCFERPPFLYPKNWCHRRLVAEWFGHELGHRVPEHHAEDFVDPPLLYPEAV